MHTKHHIITFAVLILSLTVKVAAEPVHTPPVIPEDSLTTALYRSFTMKLDSAQRLAGQGDYQEAVRLYATSFGELKQYNEQRRKHDALYLAKHYETEQKEQHIAFLNETLPLKQRQNLLLFVLCAITVITLTLLFTFQEYRLRNIRQRAAQRENEAHLMELESEQRELEARLQTLQTEKYQKELLAESLLVNNKNKVLNDLRYFIVQNPKLSTYHKELEAIFQTVTTQTETTGFCTTVDEIHPSLYQKLQERAANRLSTLDLEYIRMIYMRMTSKQMAEILQVDPNTIRTGKHRLKQKLQLSKEEDLNGFIEGLGAM